MDLIIGAGSTKPTNPYEKYYGIIERNWKTRTSQTFEAVNPDLMADSANPWWMRIRSFIENPDGSVKYYLDRYDSRYREGGTAKADLTGKSGNVMVEIPEHYVRIEYHGDDRYRLYSDYPLPGFKYVPRRVISKFHASRYTGTTVAGSALVNTGLCSVSLLQWDNMAYMQVNSGDESPIKRHTITSGDISYKTPYFGEVGSAEHTLAEQLRGGNVSGTTLDETYHSELGMCRTGISRTEYRTDANNVNKYHGISDVTKMLHIGAFHILNELAWAARCKYLNYDIQNVADFGEGSAAKLASSTWSTWGGGQYEPFLPCGVTAPLGDRTGYLIYKLEMANGTETNIKCGTLFGVELPIAYIWHNCDDLLVYNTTEELHCYICKDPAKFATPADSAAESWAEEHGYELVATLPMFASGNSGYYKNESVDEDGNSYPRETGGGATSGVGDYFYHITNPTTAASKGWFCCLLGGHASFGAGAGFGYLNAAVRPAYTDANIGARLCRN